MNSSALPLNVLHQRIELLGEFYNLPENWLQNNPNLFSNIIIQLTKQQDLAIKETVFALQTIINSTPYLEAIKKWNPHLEGNAFNNSGLIGYDFHIDSTGPRLIEINTNPAALAYAGLLRRALQDTEKFSNQYPHWEAKILSLFIREWKAQRGDLPLQRIAIVDVQPKTQNFYYEFLLFQEIFKNNGIDAIVIDPSEIIQKNNKLYYGDLAIDLIYNRLTDFNLEQEGHRFIDDARKKGWVVVTPDPGLYSLYANKQNLTLLSNAALLKQWNIPDSIIEIIKCHVPRTFFVEGQDAEDLWNARKGLFFKPFNSYGGKGVYAGSKLTRGTFQKILKDRYIAQELVSPQEVEIFAENDTVSLKYDVRYYAYQGEVIERMARLYRGQTPNFNVLGGGLGIVEIR